MLHRSTLSLVLLAAALCAAPGCAAGDADYLVPARLQNGIVFCLDGIGGYNWGPQWLRAGLDDAGVNSAIYIFPWGRGPAGMFLADLMDEAGNRKRAAELARMVENYQKYYPGRPVYLIGHSGGAGIVVFALEAMQNGAQVDSVFLLAPALDPDRNLTPALAHVRNHLYATHSAADLALLGLGTSTFGTMDRKHTISAGLLGFRVPDVLSADEQQQYLKLLQAGWQPNLLTKGNLGGHMSWTTASFARQYIAPVLLGLDVPPLFKGIAEPQEISAGVSDSRFVGRGGGI